MILGFFCLFLSDEMAADLMFFRGFDFEKSRFLHLKIIFFCHIIVTVFFTFMQLKIEFF